MTLIGMSQEDKHHDVDVLNRSLYFENQGVWAYDFAATKLTQTNVGKAVLALALENQADHKKHQELLISAIHDLGGTPVQALNIGESPWRPITTRCSIDGFRTASES